MPGKEAQEALQLIERGDFRCREYVMDMEQKNIYEEFLAEVADDKKVQQRLLEKSQGSWQYFAKKSF